MGSSLAAVPPPSTADEPPFAVCRHGDHSISLYVKYDVEYSDWANVIHNLTMDDPQRWTVTAWDSDRIGYFLWLIERDLSR